MTSEHLKNVIDLFNNDHSDLAVGVDKDDRLILEANNGDTFDLDPQILFFWYDDIAELDKIRSAFVEIAEAKDEIEARIEKLEKGFKTIRGEVEND